MGLKIKKTETDGTNVSYRPFTMDFSIIWHLLAFFISWATNKSVGWAIFHTIFGFLYIIWWAITGENANEAGIKEIYQYWKTIFN